MTTATQSAQELPESGHREFRFGDLLGKGGFGEVYLAEMNTSGGLARKVAIKLLHAGLDAEASQAVERLRDEGRMLAVLAHPSVLGIVDVITLEQRVALVTEYVDGEDLDGCFSAHIPPRALVQVIGEVASALSAAWTELQLVHRDIKPANIRVGRHGQVKLLDFGIASTDQLTRAAKTGIGDTKAMSRVCLECRPSSRSTRRGPATP